MRSHSRILDHTGIEMLHLGAIFLVDRHDVTAMAIEQADVDVDWPSALRGLPQSASLLRNDKYEFICRSAKRAWRSSWIASSSRKAELLAMTDFEDTPKPYRCNRGGAA